MNKILLTTKEEFEEFERNNTGRLPFYGNTSSCLDNPEKYPCVLVWDIEDNLDGPSHLRGEFVYLDDFRP